MRFLHTLVMLQRRTRFHQRQSILIKMAEEALESGKGLIYEAHRQGDMPDLTSIMAQGPDFHLVLEKSTRLWNAYNPGKPMPKPELFIRCGSIRVAISPDDNTPDFKLDSRIENLPAQMVFQDFHDTLPSAWYASVPTPEPSLTCPKGG